MDCGCLDTLVVPDGDLLKARKGLYTQDEYAACRESLHLEGNTPR